MKTHILNVVALAVALVVTCAVQFHLTAAPVPKMKPAEKPAAEAPKAAPARAE